MSSYTKIDQKTKDQVAQLANQDFVQDVLNKKLAEYYPDFQKIKKLALQAYKKHLGQTSAVFVVGYQIEYLDQKDQIQKLHLFATAHSDDSRRSAFEKLNFLYQHGFDKGKFQVTRPLFFLQEQKGFFYEASEGESLYSFFKEDQTTDIKPILELASGWIKELHALAIDDSFNWPHFSVSKMVPAPAKFLPDFYSYRQSLGLQVTNIVDQIKQWEDTLSDSFEKKLIYGDYHPENIIIPSLQAKTLKMIDFTDIALGDPMTDLGTFLQQVDFMGHRFFSRAKVNQYKEDFVCSYFKKELTDIPEIYFQRINLYQAWTALRTGVFLFYMHRDDSVKSLLEEVESYIALIVSKEKKVNIH